MQTQMQAMLLSVQKTVVDRNTYAKAFIALSPNGETDAISSVMQLSILEEKADQVFAGVMQQGIQLGEVVTVTTNIVRGAQNSVKQVVTDIQRLAKQPAAQPAQQQQPQQQGNKQENKS